MSIIQQFVAAKKAGHPAAGAAASRITLDRARRTLELIERLAQKPLLSLTVSDAESLVHVIEKYQSKNRVLMLATLRNFYEWAIAERLTKNPNPFWYVGRTDRNPHRVDRLSWQELNRVFNAAPMAFADKHEGLTVQLVIGLIGLAGLRLEEVLELRKDDVRDDGVIVRRDGRFVPLPSNVFKVMDKVMAFDDKSPFVIRGRSGRTRDDEPMTPSPMNIKINKVFDSLGLDRERYKPLSLRESFLARAEERLEDQSMYYTLVGHAHVNRQPTIPFYSKKEIKKAYDAIVK